MENFLKTVNRKFLYIAGSFLVLGLLLLLARASNQTVGASLTFVSGPEIRSNPNLAVPLAAILTFESSGRVSTQIEITTGESRRVLKYGPEKLPQQGLPLIGFCAGFRHEIRVTISDPEGKLTPATAHVNFTAPALPAEVEVFPIIETKRLSNAPMEPGVTIFNPRRRAPVARMSAVQAERFNQGFGLLVALDVAGNVIWFYRSTSRISDFEILRNGNIVFLTQDFRAVEIDLLGNIITQWYAENRPQGAIEGAIPVDTLTFHHDIDELPNGNLLVLGSERKMIPNYFASEENKQAPRKDQWVMGDEVVEFSRDGKVVWRWKAFEHLDVFRIGYETFSGYWERRGFRGTIDWSHANSIVTLDDESILVNYRYQSAITKIDRKTGDISWIAGEPSGWSRELQPRLLKMKGDAKWFWHQHGPTITPAGTLLLFDNGNFQARPFQEPTPPAQTRSRMVEYSLDQDEGFIQERWSTVIPDDPPVVSFAMGSTQYLPETGNLLAGYGFLLSQDDIRDRTWQTLGQSEVWTRIREYTHASPPKVVWELTLRARDNDFGLGWNLFGARRIEFFPMSHCGSP